MNGRDEWVYRFVDGLAVAFPVDSAAGQNIVMQMSASQGHPGVCPAPRALFPNLTCGKMFLGRKGQKFCSPTCQKRERRATQRSSVPA